LPCSPLHRRTLLQGLATSAAWPAWAAAEPDDGEIGFVAVGDWGRRGQRSQREVARAMGAAAQEITSRFVISAGDNFYPAGVRSVADPHWKVSFEDVYTAPALQTAWYAALGNHDYRGVAQAQVDYTRHSRRWRMPDRYYKVSAAALGTSLLDLFVIDTSPLVDRDNYDEILQQLARGHLERRDGARQIAWLDDELRRSTAPWKIVVGHHPIYSGGHGDSAELVDQIAPLLEAHGVQVYINGHDHDLQHIRRGRVDYVCAGAGADSAAHVTPVDGTRYCLSRPGFAMFRLDRQALRLEFRDLTGRALYQARLDRADHARG
jgi:tartrate-resistant acid phosphatase type 5